MSLRDWFELVGYSLGSWLVRALPLRFVQGVTRTGVTFWFDRGPRRARIALTTLRIAFPELSEEERRDIARQSFVHLLWNLVDVLRSERWDAEEMRRHVSMVGLEHLERALAQGRGAFALMQHQGNFELVGRAAPAFGVPASAVSRQLRNRALFARLARERVRMGCQVIDRKNGARPMLRALREGRVVAVLNDQRSRRHAGIWVPFFGVRAMTSAGVATLALRACAPVVPVSVRRDGPDHHTVTVLPPLEVPSTGDRKRDIELATASYNLAIEAAVRAHPEQYLWGHKRFEHSPDLPDEPYRLIARRRGEMLAPRGGAAEEERMAQAGRGGTLALWVASGLLALLYLAAGVPKILGLGDAPQNFEAWGYGGSFRVFIGLCEVAGAVGLLLPRLAAWAAAGLACIMLGAAYTHLAHEVPGIAVPLVALALLVAVGLARRGEALGPGGASSRGAPAAR